MMQQYLDAKAAHPGMLVFFRNGDFYELFEQDAELGSKILGLTLTKRDKEIPMAGFPHHALERYLGVLLRAGHRVAVCEQMEEAGGGKKIIRREVNRIVTPGTVTEDDLLDPQRPNHLLAIVFARNDVLGLAWADLSTGAFFAADVPTAQAADELGRINASEAILPEDQASSLIERLELFLPRTRSTRPAWTFDPEGAEKVVREHFHVTTLTGFGFSDGQPCLVAAGALLQYLSETLRTSLEHIRRLQPHRSDQFLTLDEVTRRSLELTRTLRESQR